MVSVNMKIAEMYEFLVPFREPESTGFSIYDLNPLVQGFFNIISPLEIHFLGNIKQQTTSSAVFL